MIDTTETYIHDVEAWRTQAEQTLRADDGWLAVAGLHWLQPGSNSVGSTADNAIVLPDGAPAHAGQIGLDGTTATFSPAPDGAATINGAPAQQQTLKDDSGTPDVVAFGAVSFLIIVRGERVGVRVRDRNNAARQQFAGRVWFPTDPAWRVPTTFAPYQPPKPMTITNILGDTSAATSPGAVHFSYDGQSYALDAASIGDSGVFLVFRDGTSGTSTYGAARFLTAAPPVNGTMELDFNRAVNPPCAFTDYATCPLPPPQNRLPFAVFAGERNNTNGHYATEHTEHTAL